MLATWCKVLLLPVTNVKRFSSLRNSSSQFGNNCHIWWEDARVYFAFSDHIVDQVLAWWTYVLFYIVVIYGTGVLLHVSLQQWLKLVDCYFASYSILFVLLKCSYCHIYNNSWMLTKWKFFNSISALSYISVSQRFV